MRDHAARHEHDPVSFLAPDGSPLGPLPPLGADADELVRMYRAMVLARTFDTRAAALQRAGRLPGFSSTFGEEAVMVGAATALAGDDVLVPSARAHAAQLVRGVASHELLRSWGADVRVAPDGGSGCDLVAVASPAAQVAQALGVALAMQRREEPRVTLCLLGDGLATLGAITDAAGVAGRRRLPLVFVVDDDRWAVPSSRANVSTMRAAAAAGVCAVRVDGNDALAVRSAIDDAVVRARAGDAASLVSCVTVRPSESFDLPSWDDVDVPEHSLLDPVNRLRLYLVRGGVWSRELEESLAADCAARVGAEVATALGSRGGSAGG